MRVSYGGYDSLDSSGRRSCNWIRFLRVTPVFNSDVTIVGRRNANEVEFSIIREVEAGTELLAFLLPEICPTTAQASLMLPALHYFRSSLYKQTIDLIMTELPLDLSKSLTSPPSPPPSYGSRTPSPYLMVDDSPPSSPVSQMPSFFNFSSMMSPSLIKNSYATPPISPHVTSNVSMIAKRRQRTVLPCSECGKTFDRPSLLKRHMRTHTGEKPHVCDVCGKGFSTSSSLNTHRRIHSGEKPHQCGVCGKRFTASSNLYYHKMTHIKEKPHKCTVCTRSFPTPGDLRCHMFVHNGQWPHKCGDCGKGFSKVTNLKNHEILHSSKP